MVILKMLSRWNDDNQFFDWAGLKIKILTFHRQNPYFTMGIIGGAILLLGLVAVLYYKGIIFNQSVMVQEKHGEETPPEAFVFLEFFSELLETSAGGVGVKIAEIVPKVQHVTEMYRHGDKDKALAKTLGIATEIILVGFFVETFGIGELFISALSFQDNWPLLMAQSIIGVMISTKIALFIGEQVEEAAEHKAESLTH